MIKEAIEKILELGKVEVLDLLDRKYSTKGLVVVQPPTPAAFKAHTLTGIADYLVHNVDKNELHNLIVQVADPRGVRVISALESQAMTRNNFLNVETLGDVFKFDTFLGVEEFIIKLQTHFVDDENIRNILRIVGNLVDSDETNYEDDGFTQKVTAKTGIAKIEEVPLPNPVILKPYRTFMEVDQPSSPFVLRLKAGNNGPVCALFEADGGKWKLDAIKNIKTWLEEALPKEVGCILA